MGAPASLLGLERTSLRQQALDALRRAISVGELPPGTHLVETELSEMLKISRGTLREALRELQQEGLVSAGSRGRLSVRNLDAKEIRDVFAVRGALESLAAVGLSEMSGRTEIIAELRKAVDNMDRAAQNDIEARIESDLDFHRTLCNLAGNETLSRSWQALEGTIRMSIMFAGADHAISNMGVNRHSEIVDAIESGDAERARKTITAHMDEAAAKLVS
ncbi:MAG: GntR family transcriptional regulator [Microbacteriaceae bacterium]|jgi:DNA-binding GntR family transcriptional regulator|nr:GntR family transcriptional regulator [Microbacteriaceae bacterium]HEV7956973.1 GntR family transcriptional regulator [Marisediminicola sp.]